MNIVNTLGIFSSVSGTKILFIVLAVLFFGFIIALHESGHFLTAKLFKMGVKEFSIGMGPKIFSTDKKKRKKKNKDGDAPKEDEDGQEEWDGKTVYSLRLFPIGGFVALEGEDEQSDSPTAFGNQKAWKRTIVIAAGATLNVILGLVLVCLMLGIDGKTGTTVISDFTPVTVTDDGKWTETENTGDTLLNGDKIISVDGSRVFSSNDFYYSLYRKADKDHTIQYHSFVVKRNGEKLTFDSVPVFYYAGDDGALSSLLIGETGVTVFNVLPGAVRETASMSKMILMSLVDMVKGRYGVEEISGPVGTIDIVAETTAQSVEEKDYSQIFFILAFITVNIGLVNLLPLPALDGGRLFFIIVEIIIRRPIPKKFEAVVHAVGLILLLVLMALISAKDIWTLFTK